MSFMHTCWLKSLSMPRNTCIHLRRSEWISIVFMNTANSSRLRRGKEMIEEVTLTSG